MTQQRPKSKLTTLANLLGFFGYSSVLIQWLWLFSTLIFPIAKEPSIRNWLSPTGTNDQAPIAIAPPELPGFIQITFIVLALVFVFGAIIYMFYSIPKTIGKTGQKITQTSAKVTVSNIEKTRKLPAKERKQIFERVTWTMKLILCLIPILALFVPFEPVFGLNNQHVVVFGLFCGVVSLFWFGCQFILVRLAKLDVKQVW